ncbi:unnamed protein product [Mytilus coruscus]|uniref:Uncharacterized protein n=1 Tax=Mytilus coruscus TaxID=42192 RepID=A0A6J8BAK9_MYTCO|nr:unnamed protein product [Mytilus coruscus]
MSNNTTDVSSTAREETTEVVETTVHVQTTSTETRRTPTGGMTDMAIAGTVIGAIVAACVIACLAVLILIRYRKAQKKSKEKYKQTVKNLKIDQLPSPSEVATEELRPPGRKPVRETEIEPDLGSSVLHYQNVTELKYENVENAGIEQPIYLEPREADKRLYTTGAGSEYYVVNDDPMIQTLINKPSKDYVNLKEEIILPPLPKQKDKRLKIQAKNNLAVDEVYENEEIQKTQHSKKPKR